MGMPQVLGHQYCMTNLDCLYSPAVGNLLDLLNSDRPFVSPDWLEQIDFGRQLQDDLAQMLGQRCQPGMQPAGQIITFSKMVYLANMLLNL